MKELNEHIARFLPYLEDLRSRMYRGVVLFLVFFLIGFFSTGIILKDILSFIHLENVIVAASSPYQLIDVSMDFGFFLAIAACVPYVIYSLYAFVAPALTKSERRQLLKTVPVSIGLFLLGFSYGFVILYYALELFAAINTSFGIANFWNIGQFFSEMFITGALLGVAFEFPIVLTLLMKLGILMPRTLTEKRRVAYAIIFCVTAVLPPHDGLSFIAEAVPLIVLYEATIVLNKDNKKYHVWNGT